MKKIVIPTLLYLVSASLLAVLSIRGIGSLVGAFGAQDFVPVFDQLKHARIVPGVFLALIPAVLFAWLLTRVKAVGGKIALAAAGLVISWLAALWSTSVNSIVFGDIISALVRLLRAGALDLL